MKGGQWLQLEMGKAAPGIGEISSEETFPGAQLLLPNFGKNEELFAKFVKEEEKESVRAQQQQPSCALGS